MAFIHKLAIVVDVFTLLATSMDTRFMLIKTEETDENVDETAGNNLRIIAGGNNYAIVGIMKGINNKPLKGTFE